MGKPIWTSWHTERAKELAHQGRTDRQIIVELQVSRRMLRERRLDLEKLRPADMRKQIGERSPPSRGWLVRAKELATAALAQQIALAKAEAKDPRTPRYKGHPNDLRWEDKPTARDRVVGQVHTSHPAKPLSPQAPHRPEAQPGTRPPLGQTRRR